MNKTVSIIVPVFNVEGYLEQSIQSVLNQTFKDIEIILVDDGSTDNSSKICDNYSKLDKRIRVIHQKNKGLSGARNTGLRFASGKYIFFLDSDDWIEEKTIEKLYQIAEKDYSDVVVCNVNLCSSVLEKISKRYWPFSSEMKMMSKNIYPYFLIQPCWAWNKLYKHSFLKENRLFFVEGILYEDVPFFVDVFFKAKIVSFTPDFLYNYRVGRDGAITVKKSKRQLDILKVKELVSKKLSKYNAPQLILNNFKKWQISNFAWMIQHLPDAYKENALKKNEILQLLSLSIKEIYLFKIIRFSLKKCTSRYDLYLFGIPLFTLRRKK